jgi:hypothetical protein
MHDLLARSGQCFLTAKALHTLVEADWLRGEGTDRIARQKLYCFYVYCRASTFPSGEIGLFFTYRPLIMRVHPCVTPPWRVVMP